MPNVAEVKIKIDKETLNQYAASKIAELENELRLAAGREKRAKSKISSLENRIKEIEEKSDVLDEIFDQLCEGPYSDELVDRAGGGWA